MKRILFCLGLTLFASLPTLAADTNYRILADRAALIVVGNGVIQARPDLASVMVNVTTKAKTAREAQSLNATATKKLVDSLVSKFNMDRAKDIATISYDVSPEYKQNANNVSVLVGYIVKHSLAVKVRDITLLGAVIDHAGDKGGLVDSIEFGLSNKKPYEAEALRAAMADARQRAEVIAAANGRPLGQIVKVSEVTFNVSTPSHDMQAAEEESDSTEIFPDDVTISAQLTVEYEF